MGKKIHRDPARSQTWNLVNTSQMLSPLSHWTHDGEVEAGGLNDFRLAVGYTAEIGIPCERGCVPKVDWLYNCTSTLLVSRCTHYLPPQPLASQATPFTKGVVCETMLSLSQRIVYTLNTDIYTEKSIGICIITTFSTIKTVAKRSKVEVS